MILRSAAAALALSSVLAVSLARAQDPPPAPPPPPPPEARDIVQGVCVACHGLDFIAQHPKDRDGWDFTVRRMVDKGADLGVDDIPLVVDYLAKAYPRAAEKPGG